MSIKIYASEKQHPLVNVKQFENELKKYLIYNQDIKVFFINNPRIKGLVNTGIDLLLILAVENKNSNFYTITSQPASQPAKKYILTI